MPAVGILLHSARQGKDRNLHLRPSPNFGARRDGLSPSIIVIHYTAMQNAEVALDRLCDPLSEVSAHYLICKTGAVTRMVEEEHRAWHAGAGEWRGITDINSRSIGIELDNDGSHPFPEPQMTSLEALLRDIGRRWPIAAEDIIAHSDMAPGRKTDPGPRFDWARLARQGLAGPTRFATHSDDFLDAARAAGFTADTDRNSLLEATRLRFAPWRFGPESEADLQLFHRI